ncbi:MAG: dTDP-4-dehydrorhamnose reductase, partial [Oscillospiraceae bacterium]|nr:dTDP-4-dehydrorhamnose reductase [Oscillospiraceae bacterium]
MKILITGSNGQLGNELSSILGCGISEIGAISSDYKDCEVIAVDVDRL